VFCERIGNVKRTYRYIFVDYIQKNMSFPDGLISCKGFAYNICNINTSNGNTFIRLGTISGVTGSHVKIECLLGNSNKQGNTYYDNTLPINSNAPILLTIYSSFHDNTTSDEHCNFEGFYNIVGQPTNNPVESINVEYNQSNYNYNVYMKLNSANINTNLNYFVYLPNNCTWVNDGKSYGDYVNGESRRFTYSKL